MESVTNLIGIPSSSTKNRTPTYVGRARAWVVGYCRGAFGAGALAMSVGAMNRRHGVHGFVSLCG